MELNNWEDRDQSFLSKVFDGDSKDIIEFLKNSSIGKVVEVGFGNSRLLPKILAIDDNIKYFGIDKTSSFVERAKREFSGIPEVTFYRLNISNLSEFSKLIKVIKPDVLILRYIIEHLPKWIETLRNINELEIPNLLISIHTPYVKHHTWSVFDISNDFSNAYTLNFFCEKNIDNKLTNYETTDILTYNKVPHTFRVYKLIK